MKKEFSIYLDLVRFIAAVLVVIHHSNMRELSASLVRWSSHGPDAVIVFFVLSGYVIAYITATRERDPLDYWASRLSRFYTLAIPIVLLCPLLDAVGESFAVQFYGERTTHGLVLLRMVTSLTYMNEIWNMAIMSFSNVPYWSLNYEMWYYLFFAMVTFTRANVRTALLCLGALVVGPKILLLAPLWILGVVLQRWGALYRLPQSVGWLLLAASFPLYYALHVSGWREACSDFLLAQLGPVRHANLAVSKYFITDYLLGLIVAANFIGFRTVAAQFARPLRACERPIRWVAAYTFPLYILHQPLLQFFGALINGDPHSDVFYAEVLALVLLTVLVFGGYAEAKRPRVRDWLRVRLGALTAAPWWRGSVARWVGVERSPS